VPGKLFWSLTVYDAETRSEVVTDQGNAAFRSMFELKDMSRDAVAEPLLRTQRSARTRDRESERAVYFSPG